MNEWNPPTAGKGTSKDGGSSGNPEDDEEMHVIIEGTDEQVEAAAKEVENILFNPAEAMRLKQQQLRNLAEMKGGMMRPHGQGGGGGGDERSRPGLGYEGHYGPRDGEEQEMDEMKVPNAVVGLVIGRGGENIQRITAQTGCFVQVAKEVDMTPGEMERTVNLKGSRDAIEQARRIIQEIVESKTGGGPRGGGGGGGGGGRSSPGGGVPDGSTYGMVHSLSVQVPADKVGIIIGRQGSTIRGIQDRTGAHVQIPQPAPGDDPNFRSVNITASNLEQAQAAEAEVQGLMSGDRGPGGPRMGGMGMGMGGMGPRDPWTQPGAQAMQMHVQNHHVGLIIGRGGAHIREVQARTGTHVQIPPTSDGPGAAHRVVTITGPPEGQERARYEIETKIMNEGCRDQMGNFVPYQPSPAFLIPIGADGTPGGPPPPPGGAPPPPGYGPPPPGYGPPPPGGQAQAPPPPGYPPDHHQQQQQPQQQDPYAAYYYQQQQQQGQGDPNRAPTPSGHAPAPAAASSPAPAPASAAAETNGGGGGGGETNLTQYHDQYWLYAQHYGQEHARKRYGVWAPPEGTPVPPGIRLPSPEEAAAAIAKAEAEGTA